MAVIFVLSTDAGSSLHTSRILGPLLQWLDPGVTREEVALVQFLVRKAGHLAEYAVLAVLFVRAFPAVLPAVPARSWTMAGIAWAAAVAYAASDEFHQSFVATRTASAGDVLIDAVGAAVGLALFFARHRVAATATGG